MTSRTLDLGVISIAATSTTATTAPAACSSYAATSALAAPPAPGTTSTATASPPPTLSAFLTSPDTIAAATPRIAPLETDVCARTRFGLSVLLPLLRLCFGGAA